jgi:hypothetical protein
MEKGFTIEQKIPKPANDRRNHIHQKNTGAKATLLV